MCSYPAAELALQSRSYDAVSQASSRLTARQFVGELENQYIVRYLVRTALRRYRWCARHTCMCAQGIYMVMRSLKPALDNAVTAPKEITEYILSAPHLLLNVGMAMGEFFRVRWALTDGCLLIRRAGAWAEHLWRRVGTQADPEHERLRRARG